MIGGYWSWYMNSALPGKLGPVGAYGVPGLRSLHFFRSSLVLPALAIAQPIKTTKGIVKTLRGAAHPGARRRMMEV